MTRYRLVVSVAIGMTLVAAWLWVIPGRLGGGSTWAVIDGASMEPRLERGDFVLLRPSGRYEPGMVVGYRSALLHRIVLHRIVRVERGRYVFKGDNNDYLDPERPTASQLVGVIRLRIPQAGPTVAAFRSPFGLSIVLTLATLLIALPSIRTANGDEV